MKKKGIAALSVGVILLLAAVGIYVSPVGSVLGLRAPVYCTEDPYNSNCWCTEDQNRKGVKFNGVQTESNPIKYFCENKELLLDPSDGDFYSLSVDFSKDYLTNLFPDCDSINDCPATPNVRTVYQNTGRRFVVSECKPQNVDGVLNLWSVWVDISEGVVSSASCHDNVGFLEKQGQGDLQLSYAGEGPGYNMFRVLVNAQCEGKSEVATDSYLHTLSLNEYQPDANSWWFYDSEQNHVFDIDGIGECMLTDRKSKSVRMECEVDCSKTGDYKAEVFLGYELERARKCRISHQTIDNVKSSSSWSTICCEPTGEFFACGEDGWVQTNQFTDCPKTSLGYTVQTANGQVYECEANN